MIENGYIIALNDDAEEIGGKIPCNFNASSNGRGYAKTEDGRAIYYDAKVLIELRSFDHEGLAIYGIEGEKVGSYSVGQKRLNQMTGIIEMHCFVY